LNLHDLPPPEVLARLPRAEKEELLALLEQQETRLARTAARTRFLPFAHTIYPGFKEGPQHRVFASTFERIIKGESKRVIINIAPRHSKSESTSYLLPAFYLGHFPDHKIIMASHTASLAEDFGRRVRNLIQNPDYHEIFERTEVASDQKASGKWSTAAGGQYYAVGVGGALAGRGADLLIIDDPHSEQAVRTDSKGTFESCWAWFQTGPLQRLMPSGRILVVMTRWGVADLTGRLLQQAANGGEEWEVIELPAIMPSGKSLWPEMWPVEELIAKRDNMDPRYWSSQYMQNPTSEEGALIKREWWQVWPESKPPKCSFVIQSWDTAYTEKETADYSACTTWGVFEHNDPALPEPVNHIMLLDAFRDRMGFPELKSVAKKHYEKWKPDAFIVEAKASGLPLIYELRGMGIPVQEYSPSRGKAGVSNDKTARVNSITDLFASKFVWRPDTVWAKEVAEECAAFPNGKNDDYVDTTVMAMQRFRRGGFIRLPSDYKDNTIAPFRRKRGYYGWAASR